MKRILLLSFYFIFCAFLLNAATPGEPSQNNPAPSEFTCNLPAPANLAISNIMATSATGTWSAVSGAIGYNVEVRLASTNALEYSNFTTATTETATGLTPSEDHVMLVTSVCPNQQNGQVAAIANFSTDIVIDLLVINYQAPTCPNPGEIRNIYYSHPTLPNTTEFGIDINKSYWMEVKQERSGMDRISRYLVSYRSNQGGTVGYLSEINPMYTNPEGTPLLGTTQGLFPFYYGNQTYYELTNVSSDQYGDELVKFNLYGDQETLPYYAILKIQAFAYGWATDGRYQIKLIDCSSDPKGGFGAGEDRNADFSSLNQTSDIPQVEVFPNPFSGMVHVLNQGETSFDNCSIELTDLAGKVLIARNNIHLDPQQMLDVETASLAPGMYLVKVNSGTATRTIKLVKSE